MHILCDPLHTLFVCGGWTLKYICGKESPWYIQSRCLVLDDRMSNMKCIISRILSGYWNPVSDIRLTVYGFFFFASQNAVQIYGNMSNSSLLSSIYHIITFRPETVLMLSDGGLFCLCVCVCVCVYVCNTYTLLFSGVK